MDYVNKYGIFTKKRTRVCGRSHILEKTPQTYDAQGIQPVEKSVENVDNYLTFSLHLLLRLTFCNHSVKFDVPCGKHVPPAPGYGIIGYMLKMRWEGFHAGVNFGCGR